MPVIRRIESERGLDIGGIPSTQVDDSLARGIGQLGGAISGHADMQMRMELRRQQIGFENEEFRTNQAFQRWNDDNELEYGKSQQEIDPSGEGFTATVSGIITKRSEEFLQAVPEALRPKFEELVATSREQWLNRAAAAEINQRNDWFRTGIAERQRVLQTQVFDNPDGFTAARDDAFRTIDASGLPPAEKEELKKKTEEMFALAVGERDIRDTEADPSRLDGARARLGVPGSAVDQFVDRIIGAESGGNATARNPNSTATGAGQFIASTWLAMVRKYRPDLAEGRSSQEVLALRNDYGLSRQMTRFYAQENAQFLSAQGIAQTPGNIYLAHFLGPRGAAQVLKASPGASIEGIVGPDAVRANGFLRGKSVAWVKSWADRKMGGAKGGGDPDPRYASLTLEQRLSIYDQSMAAARRGETAIAAQEKAAYDAQKGALELGIQTGDVSSPLQIMQSGMSDAHKADLLAALRARRGDEMAIAEAVAAFREGSLTADPYSSDDRKKVDGVYDAITKAVPQDQTQAVTENLIAATGIVPSKVHNALRAGLESTVPAEVEAAAAEASRIAQISPAILGRREGGDAVQKKADLFDTLTRSMGYSASEAARRIAEQNDPEKARARAALLGSEPVKELLKKVDDTTVARAISGVSFLGWQLGENEAQRAAMVSEYRSILQETIVDANGDEEAARDLANKRFERLYGASDLTLANVGLRNVITRLPPDKVYEPLPDGSLDYVGQQLREALSAEGVQFDDVRLSSYEDTDSDFRNGEPPRYQVWYKEGGEWQLYHLPFFADRSAALAAYEAEQQRLLDERRQRMELNRQEELDRFPEGRGGPERFSNDELYYGIGRADSPLGRAARARRDAASQREERIRPQIEQDRQERQQFDTLDPSVQRERLLDEFLNGPLMPGNQ